MYVKRVYASSVREALTCARQQLGDGALVLSTELVPASGWRGWIGQRVVRLTAAAERGIVETADSEHPIAVSENRPPVPADRPLRNRRSHQTEARSGVIARLTASGLDARLAGAVASRLTDAECRGGAEHALRRALAA